MYIRAHDPRARNLVAMGFSPPHVLQMQAADDPDWDFRQTGIIDRHGNVAAHTGPRCGHYAAHIVGPGYAAFGNGLAGPQVVQGIVSGFLADPDSALEYRLLHGVEGGQKAGGQETDGRSRPSRSAWLRVVDRADYPEIDVRVDLHADPLAELRRALGQFLLYRDYYRDCDRTPPAAAAEEDFVAAHA
jgi:uncharacterized Ntn-hydrolase superfamily protein